MSIDNKRVYELAKEYGMTNKDFIEYLDTKLDIKVKSHSSNLSPTQIDKIKASFSKNQESDTAKKPKAFIIKKAKPVTEEIKKEPADKKEISEPQKVEEIKKEKIQSNKPKKKLN